VANDSAVSGTKVKDALNTLDGIIGALAASQVSNDSGVSGAKVKDALDTLLATIGALVASGIGNDSAVSGATVKDALNTLNSALPSQATFDHIMDSDNFLNSGSLGAWPALSTWTHNTSTWGWPTLAVNDLIVVERGGDITKWTDSNTKNCIHLHAAYSGANQITAIGANASPGSATLSSDMKLIIRLFKRP
jgi:hypothetical protein